MRREDHKQRLHHVRPAREELAGFAIDASAGERRDLRHLTHSGFENACFAGPPSVVILISVSSFVASTPMNALWTMNVLGALMLIAPPSIVIDAWPTFASNLFAETVIDAPSCFSATDAGLIS